MKYLGIFIILTFLLSGCLSEGLVIKRQKPDYLQVFNEYKKTDLFTACESFKEELRRKPSERNSKIIPYNTHVDMEILYEELSNGKYSAELSCKVKLKYSLNAFNRFEEEYEKKLGKLEFEY